MIGALVGAATGLDGSIFGGRKASKAQKKASRALDEAEKDNENWFARRYNEDYTRSAEAQSVLNKARDYAEEQYRRAAGSSAVSGATDESVAQQKALGNEVISAVASDIASQATARKDAVESQYLNTKNNLTNQRISMYTGQSQNATTAAGSAMSAGMGLIGADIQSHLNSGKGLLSNLFKR